MNPQGPEPVTPQHRHMSEPLDDPEFHAMVAAFLDDEKAGIAEPEGGAENAAVGALALDRALEAAAGHTNCPVADHPVPVLLQVVGTDGIPTVRSIPVGSPHLVCVFRVLNHDDTVVGVSVLGYDGQHPPVRSPHAPPPTPPQEAPPT